MRAKLANGQVNGIFDTGTQYLRAFGLRQHRLLSLPNFATRLENVRNSKSACSEAYLLGGAKNSGIRRAGCSSTLLTAFPW